MMFPVNRVLENLFFSSNSTDSQPFFRVAVVFLTSLVAYSIPDFGKFLELVGSSICTLLGFIIPCYFHLRVFDGVLPRWQVILDYFLILTATLLGLFGTYNSVRDLFF